MTEKRSNIRVQGPIVRLSFPTVFTPKPNDQGVLKYSATSVLDAEAQKSQEFQNIRAALQEVTLAKYGSPDKVPEGFKTPIRSCKGNKHHGIHGDDAVFFNSNSEQQPGIIGPDGKTPITNPASIKAGDYVRCTYNAYTYKNKSEGVTLGLGNIQLVRRGDPLGSQIDAESEFDAVEGAETSAPAGSATEQPTQSANSLF